MVNRDITVVGESAWGRHPVVVPATPVENWNKVQTFPLPSAGNCEHLGSKIAHGGSLFLSVILPLKETFQRNNRVTHIG